MNKLVSMAVAFVSCTGCVVIEGFDRSTPAVVSFTPGEDTQGVGMLSNLELVFSKPLAESSFEKGFVELRVQRGTVVELGNLSWDLRTRTLTFDPIRPLSPGQIYTLRVDGLLDLHGQTMEPFDATFATVFNPIVRTTYLTDGVPTSYIQVSEDLAAGTRVRTTLDDPGADTEWFTADDVASSYLVETLVDGRYDVLNIGYTDPGPDGVLATDDDVPSAYVEAEWTGGVSTYGGFFNDPGPNGTWFDSDDLGNYHVNTLTEQGQIEQETFYFDLGPDGQRRTADDVVNQYSLSTYTERGFRHRRVGFVGAGNDGEFFTADDDAALIEQRALDSYGRLLGETSATDAGTDGIPFTADDTTLYVRDVTWVGTVATRDSSSYDPGPDGIALTEDDGVVFYEQRDLDTHGFEQEARGYSNPGPDGLWFNTDDVPETRTRFTYDRDGLLQQVRHFGPGLDAAFGTADDVVTYYEDQLFDADGNVLLVSRVDDPGPDGEFLTGDDTPFQRIEFDPSR